jgi:hypothetical protein
VQPHSREGRRRFSSLLGKVGKNQAIYGADASRQLSLVLESMSQNPKHYLQVAAKIDQVTFEGVLRHNEQKSAKKDQINWSHLVTLAKVADASERAPILRLFKKIRLGLQKLHEATRESADVDHVGSTVKSRESRIASITKRLATQADKLRREFSSLFDESFDQKTHVVRQEKQDETYAQFVSALEVVFACSDKLSFLMLKLDELLDEIDLQQGGAAESVD